MTCTPEFLIAESACYSKLSDRYAPGAIIYLLCQWANAPTCDADAQAFIDAAGITDETQIGAVCQLVEDLKNNGTPSYWSREVLIYPFVGGTALAHSINLRSPGTFDLTYAAAGGPIHSAFGIQGTGVASQGWASTGYLVESEVPAITTQNYIRIFYYLDLDTAGDAQYYFGAGGTDRIFVRSSTTAGIRPIGYAIDDITVTNPYNLPATVFGAWVIQRKDIGTKQAAYGGNGFVNTNVLVTGKSAYYIKLLTYNNTGATPVGDATHTSWTSRLSAFSLGCPFANDADWLGYRAIWETFQTTLGRNH